MVPRTPPAADASPVARGHRRARLPEIVGTVLRGRRAIFLATRSAAAAGRLARRLGSLIAPEGKSRLGIPVGAAAPIEALLKPAFPDECRSETQPAGQTCSIDRRGHRLRRRRELAAILRAPPGRRVGRIFSGLKAGGTASFALPASAARGRRRDRLAEPFTVEALVSGDPRFVFSPGHAARSFGRRRPEILARLPETRVVDLSGAFRLRGADYPLVRLRAAAQAPPGGRVRPDGVVQRRDLERARLVANPGCCATSALLALKPIAALLDRTQPVVCDSKSGVSGAGKGRTCAYSFTELFGNSKAYSAGTHRRDCLRSSRTSTPARSSSRSSCTPA